MIKQLKKQFAKVFDRAGRQVLFVRCQTDGGNPCIHMSFMMSGGLIQMYESSAEYEDSIDGEVHADKEFDSIDESEAFKRVKDALRFLNRVTPG